jgi:hypothetical protein
MSSPILFGGNNTSKLLQNQIMTQNGRVINANGLKNYISYNNFENGLTTGWSLKHTTLSSLVPNQTSGSWTSASANLAISAQTSGPLVGTTSLQMQQSTAASTAGDMLISDAFTIDTEDQAKMLQIRFSYSATANASNLDFSGTSTNTLQVYIYDTANSAWIQPAGVYNLVQNSGVGQCMATFQTPSNATSFQLAIINVNASAGIYTILFDSFFCGPQIMSMGPAMSDIVSWTPTGSWTSNTTYTGKYRRDGDTAIGVIRVSTSGAPTSANLIVNLPFTIDTAKLISTTEDVRVGFGIVRDSGAASYTDVIVLYATSTTLQLQAGGISTFSGTVYEKAQSAINQALPITFGAGDYVEFNFTVPVAGWSSNTVQSSDTDTRVNSMYAALQVPTGTITNAFNIVKFGTITSDTNSAYNTSTGQYLCPVAGWWHVDATLEFAHGSIAAGNAVALGVYKNGNAVGGFNKSAAGSTSNTALNVGTSYTLYCNAGDLLDVRSYSSGTTPTYSNALAGSSLSIYRLSGPAVVQATETVACRYTDTSGAAIQTSLTGPYKYQTKYMDTHNIYSTSTGLATIPVSGKYRVSASVATDLVTLSTTQIVAAYLYIDGNLYSTLGVSFGNGANNRQFACGSDTVQLNAGQTVAIWPLSNATVNGNPFAGNFHFSLERIGN